MNMLVRSQLMDFNQMHEGNGKFEEGVLYYSFRPVWLGLVQEIKNDINSAPILIDSRLGGSFLLCENALSDKIIYQNELLPANSRAVNNVLSRYLNNNGAMVLENKENRQSVVILDVNGTIYIDKFEKLEDNSLVTLNKNTYSYSEKGHISHYTAMGTIADYIKNGFTKDVSWYAALMKKLDNIQEIRVTYAQLEAACQLNGIESAIESRFQSKPRQLNRLITQWDIVVSQFAVDEKSLSERKNHIENYYLNAQSNAKQSIESKNDDALVRWADLDNIGIYLGEQKFSDGKDRLMLIDTEDYIVKNNCLGTLKEIGFEPLKGQRRFSTGVFVFNQDEQALRPASLAKALNLQRCPLKEVRISQIPEIFRKKAFERFELNLNNITLRAEYLGLNANKHKVYQGELGRFVRISDIQIREAKDEKSADYLYATSGKDLRLCAEGFVHEILNGERKNWRDVIQFARTVFEMPDPSEVQLHGIQEAIEAAAYRTFVTENKGLPTSDLYKRAQNLYFGLPVARMRTAQSVTLQQFSTPLPISVIAQSLLVGRDQNIASRTVLEPTAGNAGLLFNLDAQKSVVELDSERFQVLKETLPDASVYHGDATTVDFRNQFNQSHGFDYVISNPPFGQMEKSRSFGPLPKVNRIDHYIALRALESRKSDGRAVLIIGADSAQSDGTIKGSARNVMNYLYDFYQIHGAVEVDGRLYSRQGSAYNIRLLVVGDRKDAPNVSVVPEKLPLLSTYDELWQWAGSCIDSYPEQSLSASGEIVLKNTEIQADTETDAPLAAAVRGPKGRGIKRNERVDEVIEIEPGQDTNVQTTLTHERTPENEKKEVQETVRHVNEFQAPYISLSKVAPPSTMIPINMSSAVYSALNKLVLKVGDVDKYVATKLKYNIDELDLLFSPEQVDAIALGINAVEENRGMINADQTGIGKGRFVAAMLRYAKLNDKRPVFLTIKPELFTDIFRDIRDIKSEHLFKEVFIFNNNVDVKVYGSESDVLYPATTMTVLNDALKKGEIESRFDLIMATYSQFQRERSKNKKSELLLSITDENTMLLLDESHVAAGASQIAEIVGDAVANSGGVIYASATPIKGVKNFALYSKCFPPSVDTVLLPETLALGGESLQEAISTNMAMDGAIIRREHDYSKLTFKTRFPDSLIEQRNRAVMDAVAEILSELSYLSGDVSKIVKGINETATDEWEGIPENLRQGNRMNASSMNFGSRLYNITRQFLLGTKTESVIADALEAISEGRKPVVAVENTGESLLKTLIAIKSGAVDLENELDQLYSQDYLTPEEKLRQLSLESQLEEVTKNIILENTPQFRDLLEIMLDRIATIKIVGRYGDITIQNAADDPEYFDQQENLREKIRSLPDLPLSPIDELKVALEAKGYRVGEVSGRKTSLVPVEQEGVPAWRVETHAKADAVANVAAFQNGKHDAIVITRSGSTGISLHASNRFADSDARQRQFIVWQKAGNIAEFLQWMGRVNRKDQVCSPIVSNIESGLPAESRQTMMHNTKLRKLSANTTSNRDNENLEGDIDLLNVVGDKIALDYLCQHPDMADNLDISLPKDGETTNYLAENPYINKLMSRLMMLPVAQQEMIIDTLVERYKEKIEELDQANQNPFKVSVFDWKARTIHEEELVSGNLNATDSSFDEPVKLVTLEYEKTIEPIRFPKILSLLEINSKNTYRPSGRSELNKNYGADEFLDEKLKTLQQLQLTFILSHLPAKMQKEVTSVMSIRSLKGISEGAKKALEHSDYILENIKYMRIGKQLELVDSETEKSYKAIIVDISFPKYEKDCFQLSKYRFSFASPGRDNLINQSLSVLYKDNVSLRYGNGLEIDYRKTAEKYAWHERKLFDRTAQEYNDATGGKLLLRRNTLEGNIYRASELAVQQNMGYPALYTDENGNRKRAIMVKPKFSPSDIKSIPLSLKAIEASNYVTEWIAKNMPVTGSGIYSLPALKLTNYSSMDRGKEFIEIKVSGIKESEFNFKLLVNGTKSANNGLITNGTIFTIEGSSREDSLGLILTGNRTEMSSNVPSSQLPGLLNKLQAGKYVGNFYIHSPDKELIDALKKKNIAMTKNHGKQIDDDLSCAS